MDPDPGHSELKMPENQKVILNNFGCENLSHVSIEDLTEWACNPESGIVAYVRKVHYDPDMQENHNIKKMGHGNVGIYSEGTWKSFTKEEYTTKMLSSMEAIFKCILMLRHMHQKSIQNTFFKTV